MLFGDIFQVKSARLTIGKAMTHYDDVKETFRCEHGYARGRGRCYVCESNQTKGPYSGNRIDILEADHESGKALLAYLHKTMGDYYDSSKTVPDNALDRIKTLEMRTKTARGYVIVVEVGLWERLLRLFKRFKP